MESSPSSNPHHRISIRIIESASTHHHRISNTFDSASHQHNHHRIIISIRIESSSPVIESATPSIQRRILHIIIQHAPVFDRHDQSPQLPQQYTPAESALRMPP
jgi:hypothetical protein